jgi:type VI secretion system protein VasG
MNDISLETVTGKLNSLGYDAFLKSFRQAKAAGNRNVELAHWFLHIAQNEKSDLSRTLEGLRIDRGKVISELTKATAGFRVNETEMPTISTQIIDLLDRGWHYATLLFGDSQIRSGHLLVAVLKSRELLRALSSVSPLLGKMDPDSVIADCRNLWQGSDEASLRSVDGSTVGPGSAPGPAGAGQGAGEPGLRGTAALDRFTVDLTAQAKAGKIDPVVGRDEEIRRIIDVLLRRRQNNPILTGEAGVGKTAVVEGFALKLAAGEVPPQLKGVRLLALDIGLMQAGASLRGEFEQRLRSVMEEVQSSPTRIILFIDEAHTLIGAGGNQGTGDAANLLKPPLARGTLTAIGATTFAEYRQYFEKDPALTRRFQPIQVDEPSIERCCFMMRGILGPMEAHHGVRISDEALVAAVELSARYIPARQLPDKSVSLLDTACAKVAISQSAVPPLIEDLKVLISADEKELASLENDSEIGATNDKRIAELKASIAERQERLQEKQAVYEQERGLVEEILTARKMLKASRDSTAPTAAKTVDPGATDQTTKALPQPDAESGRLSELLARLAAIPPDERMVYPHVDEQAVASVLASWTGIPVGRMVRDEIQAVLNLSETLGKRVIGQKHGIDLISRRIAISRAKLDNPDKPIGVFMLCGPSGVGKTETALALAETIYGGEQNMVTINMSEFQEAHSVSLLKGAPPGYVGYGEGGRLTEAVRRKPYSAILLDEVEKAHPDVHELFFQVFDKGRMEDGTGRVIDFKNSLIILTSNVGTDVIMQLTDYGRKDVSADALNTALRPHLLEVFPPALLGRMVVIPYVPLSDGMLGKIVRLQLDRVGKRVKHNYDAAFQYSDAVVDFIVSQCNDPDSGGRMIDNIITNRLLPDLARQFLDIAMKHSEFSQVLLDYDGTQFQYAIS